MLIPFTYILMYVLGGALRPGYNHIVDSVSELLSPGAPNRVLITGIDLIYGLLHILFGIGVLQFFQNSENKSLIGSIGIWMIVGAGIAIIGTAIFPQDDSGKNSPDTGIWGASAIFITFCPADWNLVQKGGHLSRIYALYIHFLRSYGDPGRTGCINGR
jgi:hypothetical protein